MIAFTKTIAREVARSGVTANTVCPGPTETPMLEQMAGADEQGAKVIEAMSRAVPMKRLGTPEDVARGGRVPRLRGGGLHHRPDAVGERRPDDGLSVRQAALDAE